MLPSEDLKIECQQMNPPNPIGVVVTVDGEPIAVVSLQQFDEAVRLLADLRAKRECTTPLEVQPDGSLLCPTCGHHVRK